MDFSIGSGKDITQINALHYETGSPVRIEIRDGIIISVKKCRTSGSSDGIYVAPGLIDSQVNGYAGVDFSGDKLTADSVAYAAYELSRTGVTSFFPTVVTGPPEIMEKNFGVLSQSVCDDELAGKMIPGFHLEGPYISDLEGFRGCHPAEYIRKPSVAEFERLYMASGRRIIEITLAPECEKAMDLISHCHNLGIHVAIGHSNASAAEIREAAGRGAVVSTHLGNGCANMIHRHLNPLWPQLADDRLTASVIADGLHLTADELIVFQKVKGVRNIILVSDVMYLAGRMPGKYVFLGRKVELTPEGMLKDAEANCLAGASFPLIKGVENMMRLTGCSLADALNMASVNVAQRFRLPARAGLMPRQRADLILFTMNGGRFSLVKTVIGGKEYFQT